MEKQMQIKTERLLLREIAMADAEDMFRYVSDPENTAHMVYFPHYTLEQTIENIKRIEAEHKKENPGFYEIAVILNEIMIGHVSAYLSEDGAELAWIISKEHWGRGYATEAAQGLMYHLRDTLDIHHFFAMCDHRNEASRRVMLRLGMEFEYEGIRPYQENGKDVPELVYGMNI